MKPALIELHRRFLQGHPELFRLNRKARIHSRFLSASALIFIGVLILAFFNWPHWLILIPCGIAGLMVTSYLKQYLNRRVPYISRLRETRRPYINTMLEYIEGAELRYLDQPPSMDLVWQSRLLTSRNAPAPDIRARNWVEGSYKGWSLKFMEICHKHPANSGKWISYPDSLGTLLFVDYPEAPVYRALIFSKGPQDREPAKTHRLREYREQAFRKTMGAPGVEIPIQQADYHDRFTIFAPSLADTTALNQATFLDTIQHILKLFWDCRFTISIQNDQMAILIRPGELFKIRSVYRLKEINIFFLYYLEALNICQVIDILHEAKT